jgi:hypothetical protein
MSISAAEISRAKALADISPRYKAIADARKKAKKEQLHRYTLELESLCETEFNKFIRMDPRDLSTTWNKLIVNVTHISSLILYLDPEVDELLTADTKLHALKIINKYASYHAIRFEDAVEILETKLWALQDQYSINRPEVKKLIETAMEDASRIAGAIFDEKAAAEKADAEKAAATNAVTAPSTATKKIAEIEKAITELQAKLLTLKSV